MKVKYCEYKDIESESSAQAVIDEIAYFWWSVSSRSLTFYKIFLSSTFY